MSRVDCEQALSNLLRPELEDLGFDADRALWFSRSAPLTIETLRFGARLEPPSQLFFSGTAGICLKSVEAILRPNWDGKNPTIAIPLHLLREDREYFEWSMSAIEDSSQVAVAILEEIRSYALPFFEEFSQIENVERSLQSPNARDWFVLGPEQRLCVLAAIAWAAGDEEKALRILGDAISERQDSLPRKRRRLEALFADLRRRTRAIQSDGATRRR